MQVRPISPLTVLIIAAIAIVGLFFFLGTISGGQDYEKLLPLVSIGGLLVLLVTLLLASYILKVLGLADAAQAFALPSGTIRATLALGLLVIFSILATYLFSSLQHTGRLIQTPPLGNAALSAFKAAIPTAQIVSTFAADKAGNVSVLYVDLGNPSATDFAKQLLAMVGALLASVVGFYFGAQTAASSQAGETKKTRPFLRGIKPNEWDKASPPDGIFKIQGDSLDLIKDVKAVLGAQQIAATTVTSNSSEITCTFDLAKATNGAWDVIATDGLGEPAQLAAAINVK